MSDSHYKDYCLGKYHERDPLELINRKLLIHKQLEKPPRTYVVYSDLHGSFEKYLSWLKAGLGYYKICVGEVLGDSYSSSITDCFERLLYYINRTRYEAMESFVYSEESIYDQAKHFFEPVPKEFIAALAKLEEYGLTRRRILLDCLLILKEITRGDERRIIKIVPVEYLENILKLFHQNEDESFEGLINGIVKSEVIFQFITSLVVRLIVLNIFDKHINLGDTFDRGEGADYLLKLYKANFGGLESDSPLHYIWGNHDILWLGAGIGNPILCIEAIRISMRYNNVGFLRRYGFDLQLLENLARKTYKNVPSGTYIKSKGFPEEEAFRAAIMTKTLLILQMKLTLTLLRQAVDIPGEIDYSEELSRHESLMALLPTGILEDQDSQASFMGENPLFQDAFFPTIDTHDPAMISQEEQCVIDDIVSQFLSLEKVQDDIRWLLNKGETYRVVDNTLYFHAALPSNPELGLVSIKGRSGKSLLDFIQRDLKRISHRHSEGKEVTLREKMLFWHLWSGKDSPFFCKSKMATLERAVFVKEEAKDPLTSHKEIPNPFYANIRNDVFLNKVLTEFHADKLCMGHTPIKSARQAILSETVRAFIVDGGAAVAYGDRGAVLINTPDYHYLTFHPSLAEIQKAEIENRLPDFQVKCLEERGRLKLRHMEKGYFLERELEAIDELLDEKLDSFKSKYFQ